MINFFNRILRFADANDGTGSQLTTAEAHNAGQTGSSKKIDDEGAPPMSHIAVTGKKSEREIELETALDNERARANEEERKRIAREKDLSDLQDKHARYRSTVEAPKPSPFKLPPTVLD